MPIKMKFRYGIQAGEEITVYAIKVSSMDCNTCCEDNCTKCVESAKALIWDKDEWDWIDLDRLCPAEK